MTNEEIETWLAEMPDDAERVRVAKLNPAAPWAQPWIEQAEVIDFHKRHTDVTEAFDNGLTAFCKREGITRVWTEGLEAYRATDEGARLNEALHQLNDETIEG